MRADSIGVLLVQFPGPFLQFPYLAGFQRDMHMIGLVVAIDRVFAHQRLRELQRLDGKVKQTACIVASDVGDEALLACGQTENRLAAAAAGGTIADKMRLQQGDLKPSLGQMQRRRTTGDSAAEHGYIDADVAAQRLARTSSAARRRVRHRQPRLRSRKGRGDRRGASGLFSILCLKFSGY